MFVIGLSGKMGVGKTTTAHLLSSIFWRPVKVLSFADAVREEIEQHFGITVEMQRNAKSRYVTVGMKEKTIREVMQWWGTEVRRAANPAYWVEKMAAKVRALPEKTVVVIDDVRFPDEAMMVRSASVWSPGRVGKLYRIDPFEGYQIRQPEHASETAMDSFGLYEIVFKPEFGRLGQVAELIAKTVREEVAECTV